MFANEVLDRFAERSPESVMVRATMENTLTPEVLDGVFESHAKRQHCRELLFSSVVDLPGLVVEGTRKSVNDAYLAERERLSAVDRGDERLGRPARGGVHHEDSLAVRKDVPVDAARDPLEVELLRRSGPGRQEHE